VLRINDNQEILDKPTDIRFMRIELLNADGSIAKYVTHKHMTERDRER
jgi:hypothetical protein